MEIAFETQLLRTICENEEKAIYELGQSIAEVLKHRLADLRAAISVYDLPVGKPRSTNYVNHSQSMVINLDDEYQLIFCANHLRNPFDKKGNIDWQKVSRIKILQIERNYDHK